jgi:hypothetical protein
MKKKNETSELRLMRLSVYYYQKKREKEKHKTSRSEETREK